MEPRCTSKYFYSEYPEISFSKYSLRKFLESSDQVTLSLSLFITTEKTMKQQTRTVTRIYNSCTKLQVYITVGCSEITCIPSRQPRGVLDM